MLERLLESEDFILDTPYLQRQREQGRAEGLVQGLRTAIMSVLLARFGPPYSKVKQLENLLPAIEDVTTLEALVPVAARADDVDTFLEHLAGEVPSGNGDEEVKSRA